MSEYSDRRSISGPPHKYSGSAGPQWKAELEEEESQGRRRKIRPIPASSADEITSNRRESLRSSKLEEFHRKVFESKTIRAQDGDMIQQIPWRRNVHRFKWNQMVYSKWFEAYQHCLQYVAGEIMLYELYSAPQKVIVDYFCKMLEQKHVETGGTKITIPAPKHSIQKVIVDGVKLIPDCALAPGDPLKFEQPNVIIEAGAAEPEISLQDKAEVWLNSGFVTLVILFKIYHPQASETYKGKLFTASVWVKYDSTNPDHAEIKFTVSGRPKPSDGSPIQIQEASWFVKDIYPEKEATSSSVPIEHQKSPVSKIVLHLPRYALYSSSKRFQAVLASVDGQIQQIKSPKWRGNLDIPIPVEIVKKSLQCFEQ